MVVVWLVLAVGLGALAPRVEQALSGAGWEASGSESVDARKAIDRDFSGGGSYALQVVVSSPTQRFDSPDFRATVRQVEGLLAEDRRVGQVAPPRPPAAVSPDRRTALVVAGARAAPDDMVRAADDLKQPVEAAGTGDVRAALSGSAGMWSDFNEANKSAMLKSEVISWPVTLAILLLAFGSLVAAGLPLMLTVIGLISAAGMLFLGAQVFDISIWAMNFALMFALALGIDYALFIVARFRQAHVDDGLPPVEAVAEAMDTAGKAVLFSGVTVLIALSAVLLVPSPAFRSMAVGIMFAVSFVLVASLTLLPAVLAKLGGRVNRLALPWTKRGGQRSPLLAAWAARVWRRPLDLRARGNAGRGGARLAGRAARHGDAVDHGRAPRGRLAPGLRAGRAGLRSGRTGHVAGGGTGQPGWRGHGHAARRARHRPRAARTARRRAERPLAGVPRRRPLG